MILWIRGYWTGFWLELHRERRAFFAQLGDADGYAYHDRRHLVHLKRLEKIKVKVQRYV